MYNLRASDSGNGDVKIIVNLQGQVCFYEGKGSLSSKFTHACIAAIN